MDSPAIYFCEQNFDFGIDELIAELENDGFDVEVESCLGYCGECTEGPFAVVNDELITTESVEELKNRILELM